MHSIFVRGYINSKISLKVGKKLIKKSLKRTPFADLKIFTGIKKKHSFIYRFEMYFT